MTGILRTLINASFNFIHIGWRNPLPIFSCDFLYSFYSFNAYSQCIRLRLNSSFPHFVRDFISMFPLLRGLFTFEVTSFLTRPSLSYGGWFLPFRTSVSAGHVQWYFTTRRYAGPTCRYAAPARRYNSPKRRHEPKSRCAVWFWHIGMLATDFTEYAVPIHRHQLILVLRMRLFFL